VFKLAGPELGQIGARNQREDNIGWKPLLQLFFHAQSIGGVHKDAGVLRSHDRLNNVGQVVYIGKCFDAEEDVIEGRLLASCLFGGLNNKSWLEAFVTIQLRFEGNAILRDGLVVRFPHKSHVAGICSL
jgi:hypothetical protein